MFRASWCFLLFCALSQAQWFSGGSVGLATLTGDGSTSIEASRTRIALYQPKNGPAFQLFAGRHIRDYLSLQASYGYNRNPVTFTGLDIANSIENSFEQSRRLTQHSGGLDAMIYFRPLTSKVRPYVSGGAGLIYLNSTTNRLLNIKGNPVPPPDSFSNTKPYWRTAVGIDLYLKPKWRFRYTFWETVTTNPLSAQLQPRGKALFLNFLNQFGVVREF